MALLKYESFDVPTAPAIPSGWNVEGSGDLITATSSGSVVPLSAPNLLQLAGSATVADFWCATWATADGVNGNVMVQCGFAWVAPGTDGVQVGLFCRSDQATTGIVEGTSTCYYGWISDPIPPPTFFSGVGISKVIGGTPTVLGQIACSPWVSGTWYTLVLICNGSNLALQVVRPDNYQLNSSGVFVSAAGPTYCISLVDTSITGSGYAGISLAQGDANSYASADDWYLLSIPTVPLTTPRVVSYHAGYYPGLRDGGACVSAMS